MASELHKVYAGWLTAQGTKITANTVATVLGSQAEFRDSDEYATHKQSESETREARNTTKAEEIARNKAERKAAKAEKLRAQLAELGVDDDEDDTPAPVKAAPVRGAGRAAKAPAKRAAAKVTPINKAAAARGSARSTEDDDEFTDNTPESVDDF